MRKPIIYYRPTNPQAKISQRKPRLTHIMNVLGVATRRALLVSAPCTSAAPLGIARCHAVRARPSASMLHTHSNSSTLHSAAPHRKQLLAHQQCCHTQPWLAAHKQATRCWSSVHGPFFRATDMAGTSADTTTGSHSDSGVESHEDLAQQAAAAAQVAAAALDAAKPRSSFVPHTRSPRALASFWF